MRRYLALAMLMCAAAVAACDGSGTLVSPPWSSARMSNFETGTIVVYVHWQEQAIPGKTVEILGTGRSAVTDANGIARFRLAPGGYTVRVYEINRGGPALQYLDLKAAVEPYRQSLLDVVDCLPCV